MRLLLDTHFVLDVINKRVANLSPQLRHVLSRAESEIYVSVLSLWEIAIKSRLGKLALSRDLEELPGALTEAGFKLVPINEHHALALVEPEPPTRDPFDRLLLAQCQVEKLQLLTADRSLVSHKLAVRAEE